MRVGQKGLKDSKDFLAFAVRIIHDGREGATKTVDEVKVDGEKVEEGFVWAWNEMRACNRGPMSLGW